ncbi:hypothetical protein [Sulfuricurvum sp.]|uniref:hypothetical protein n=1 Tax=Sulfuricurvum sp. TaxID=2025608 RepID=UPI003BAF0F31
MFVKLHRNETYRGASHQEGDVIEVGDDLGGRMILSGTASKATKPTDAVTAESIDAMPYKAMKKLITELGIETADTKMPTYSAALKAHYGV